VTVEQGVESKDVSFNVLSTGAIQRSSGYLGFAYHIKLRRRPSWLFMAKQCRSTCGMSGKRREEGGKTYLLNVSPDVYSPVFCTANVDRCPPNLGVAASTSSARGAIVFGADDPDVDDVVCSPYDGQYAYFDEETNDYLCCNGTFVISDLCDLCVRFKKMKIPLR
jgi:hypothetical protein